MPAPASPQPGAGRWGPEGTRVRVPEPTPLLGEEHWGSARSRGAPHSPLPGPQLIAGPLGEMRPGILLMQRRPPLEG